VVRVIRLGAASWDVRVYIDRQGFGDPLQTPSGAAVPQQPPGAPLTVSGRRCCLRGQRLFRSQTIVRGTCHPEAMAMAMSLLSSSGDIHSNQCRQRTRVRNTITGYQGLLPCLGGRDSTLYWSSCQSRAKTEPSTGTAPSAYRSKPNEAIELEPGPPIWNTLGGFCKQRTPWTLYARYEGMSKEVMSKGPRRCRWGHVVDRKYYYFVLRVNVSVTSLYLLLRSTTPYPSIWLALECRQSYSLT